MQQKLQTLQTDKVLAYAPVYNIPFNQLKTIFKTSDTILSPLLNSKVEVKSITRVFGGRAFIGKRATKANFKKHASDGKILHLAMHTMVDNEYSMNLKLVFSKTGYTTNNYFLTADEIYNMKLRSPLVVLSACNSGYGKLIKGEGVISLARGFVYAGCPSMVISLWSVGDLSSSEIMFQFYKNLKNNLTIDKALQQAKIKYIINSNHMYSHPYYWAGFIQTGKTDSFIITSKNHHFVLIILLGLCLTFGVFIYWFVKEKNKPV
jgi:CHAT domain-containing protein